MSGFEYIDEDSEQPLDMSDVDYMDPASDVEEVAHQPLQRKIVDEPRALVQRETDAVLLLRTILIVLLLCAAIAVSVATYYIFQHQENDLFCTQFNDFGTTVVGSFYRSTNKKVWTANSMSTMLTSYFQDTATHPNLTLADFPIFALGARELANATAITFAPILYTDDQLAEWEAFAPVADMKLSALDAFQTSDDEFQYNRTLADGLYAYGPDGDVVDYEGSAPYAPIWLISPRFNNTASRMYNQMAEEARRTAIESVLDQGGSVFSRFVYDENDHYPPHIRGCESPRGIVYCPVVGAFRSQTLVGVIGVEFEWESYFDIEFPDQFSGMVIVLEATNGEVFSFKVEADGKVEYFGEGDLHDPAFGDMVVESSFEGMHDLCHYGVAFIHDLYKHGGRRREEERVGPRSIPLGPPSNSFEAIRNHTIHYRVKVYPSEEFEDKYITEEPKYFALGVAAIFIFTSTVFLLYDRCMERRQNLTMETAVRSTTVLNSLYPASVRERLFRDDLESHQEKRKRLINLSRNEDKVETKRSRESISDMGIHMRRVLPQPAKSKLKSFLDSDDNTIDDDEDGIAISPPIADLFPHTTVMFADIAGFTAWSSEREPSQVFQLLETLYRKFDKLAHRLGVFKVETIGDCYVAVAGLPEPKKDHALIMSRFAWEIKYTMHDTCKKLESSLGPGTADLCLRIGLHSGPVTAGVLRGEKSRFQLFGDTVNTASRIESNSMSNRIQVSQSTADALTVLGKQHWLTARETKIEAKGKGSLQTYWLRIVKRTESSAGRQESMNMSGSATSSYGETASAAGHLLYNSSGRNVLVTTTPERMTRLIDWNVDVLASSLTKLIEVRQAGMTRRLRRNCSVETVRDSSVCAPIEDLTDIIELPEFNQHGIVARTEHMVLDEVVRSQLRDFVGRIASLYRDNPFHNLEHASHVTMSASKLMNRIVVPEDMHFEEGDVQKNRLIQLAESVHNSTFGISSDPLAQFAIVFSALIHDVDHSGLTNVQLVKEGAPVATLYRGLSVAEQNSVTVAWSLLVEPQYDKLRQAIFPTASERKRFRQLVVTMVLATDIIDSELQQLRKNRWQKAFHEIPESVNSEEDMNRKATIVIEHIIQASDVAHTMQHWRIYCKWNEKLFEEKYLAYVSGHEEVEPSTYWYESEIGFLDNYVIPLAKKLKECGVFGVSSDEYLGFALENRMEWEVKGRDIVQSMALHAHMRLATKKGMESPASDDGDKQRMT